MRENPPIQRNQRGDFFVVNLLQRFLLEMTKCPTYLVLNRKQWRWYYTMAFTDFKSADEVQKAYQIKYIEEDFFAITPMLPPEYFVREFELSEKIDQDGISAKYEEGILKVTLPKLPGFETVRKDIGIA